MHVPSTLPFCFLMLSLCGAFASVASPEKHSCFKLISAVPPQIPRNNSLTALEEVMLLSCIQVHTNKTITVFEAQSSLELDRTQCSDSAAYTFVLGEVMTISTQEMDSVIDCNEGFCVIVAHRETTLFVSTPQRPTFDTTANPNVTAIGTQLPFDPSPFLSMYAQSLLDLFTRGVLDEIAIRRILFLQIAESTCELKRNTVVAGPFTTPCGQVEVSLLS